MTNKTETNPDLIRREDLLENYEEMIFECDTFINKLQKELNIDKLHESNKTFLETTKNLFNKIKTAP